MKGAAFYLILQLEFVLNVCFNCGSRRKLSMEEITAADTQSEETSGVLRWTKGSKYWIFSDQANKNTAPNEN